ncbi:MAG: DUF1223 domain-containing protein [Rhodoferax sp.]|nr:DUF1223 domain-containing protein [Rhodoferax sp.]
MAHRTLLVLPCLVANAPPALVAIGARHARWLACTALLCSAAAGAAAASGCNANAGERQTPVIELYTSEGCSSCPPADQWLSTLKGQPLVAQAFHVAYWDYIGWKDRFANPDHTSRQRALARANRQPGIYTPQVLRNGRDWRQWRHASAADLATSPARATIRITRGVDTDRFEALVVPRQAAASWTAYWTVTEHGHQSRVTAGENAGELLKQDFVVRQYVPVGQYTGAQILRFHAVPPVAGHPRQINLVVSDPLTAQPLQAVSLACG